MDMQTCHYFVIKAVFKKNNIILY